MRIPLPEEARTLSEGQAEALINYYEVIFHLHGDTTWEKGTFYIGSAERGAGFLSVAVPAGKNYDILLLAGHKDSGVLLKSIFVNHTGSVYNVTGVGVAIVAGIVNNISLSPIPIVIVPQTNFKYSIDELENTAADSLSGTPPLPYIVLPKKSAITPISNGGNLQVAVNLTTLYPLVQADRGGTNMLTLVSNTMSLEAHDPLHNYFPPIKEVVPNSSSPVISAPDSVTSTYTFGNTYLPEVEKADGMLYFELEYYGFGTSNSKSRKWFIKNGLRNLSIDQGEDPTGGAIWVQIAGGNGLANSEMVYVDLQ